jgi:hypothetical protein
MRPDYKPTRISSMKSLTHSRKPVKQKYTIISPMNAPGIDNDNQVTKLLCNAKLFNKVTFGKTIMSNRIIAEKLNQEKLNSKREGVRMHNSSSNFKNHNIQKTPERSRPK